VEEDDINGKGKQKGIVRRVVGRIADWLSN
jgi:hypothetical protein